MIIVEILSACTYRHKVLTIIIVVFIDYVVIAIATGVRSTKGNRPVSNSLQLLFESESQLEVFAMNISFHSYK